MRSSLSLEIGKSIEQVAVEKLQEQFRLGKSTYRLYELQSLIVQIYKRNFARGQIALIDDVVRPYLEQNKSLTLSGLKAEMVKELKALISYDHFLVDYPGHSDYADGGEYYHKQLLSFVPAMACQYASKLKAEFFTSVNKDNSLVSSWIEQHGHDLVRFNDFSCVQMILTALHEQDQQMRKACDDLEMYPELNWYLTLKLARVFCTAIDDETKLAAVLELLPASQVKDYSTMVRSCWPVPESVRQVRKNFALFVEGGATKDLNDMMPGPAFKRP